MISGEPTKFLPDFAKYRLEGIETYNNCNNEHKKSELKLVWLGLIGWHLKTSSAYTLVVTKSGFYVIEERG